MKIVATVCVRFRPVSNMPNLLTREEFRRSEQPYRGAFHQQKPFLSDDKNPRPKKQSARQRNNRRQTKKESPLRYIPHGNRKDRQRNGNQSHHDPSPQGTIPIHVKNRPILFHRFSCRSSRTLTRPNSRSSIVPCSLLVPQIRQTPPSPASSSPSNPYLKTRPNGSEEPKPPSEETINISAMHVPLPMAVCAAVTEVLPGSHKALELAFEIAGIPGPPPDAAHHTKWKAWLFRKANKPDADSLTMLGNLVGEFMDLEPTTGQEHWRERRERLVAVLESFGLRYFRGGRVLPTGHVPPEVATIKSVTKPSSAEEVLERLINGLIHATFPLANRRKGVQTLSFDAEADLQDLFHAMMRPWIRNILPEDYVPSYAGKNSRLDFLLPEHRLAIEIKVVRDLAHGKNIGQELTIDIDHYRKHPECDRLWCVVCDPNFFLMNPIALSRDLDGLRSSPQGKLTVCTFIVPKR